MSKKGQIRGGNLLEAKIYINFNVCSKNTYGFMLKDEDHTRFNKQIVRSLNCIQYWPKETLQVLFYEVKVPTSDGNSTV